MALRKAKFKGSHNRIVFDVLTDEPVPEYDEVLGRFCMCHELNVIGFVGADLIEFVIGIGDDDIPAIDLATKLSQ